MPLFSSHHGTIKLGLGKSTLELRNYLPFTVLRKCRVISVCEDVRVLG